MKEIIITPKAIENYCNDHSSPLPEIFSESCARTEKEFPYVYHMQVGKLEGNFLRLITQLTKAERVLEFGTFTGFSSLVFALALPEKGKVTTLDRDPKATALARELWQKAQVEGKVELLLGDAKDTIQTLETEIQSGQRPLYDLAFIDADKAGYINYFEASLKLLKKGGAILVDNVLWSGAVLDPRESSDHTICAFNEKLKVDSRIELVVLPIRDGITLAIVK